MTQNAARARATEVPMSFSKRIRARGMPKIRPGITKPHQKEVARSRYRASQLARAIIMQSLAHSLGWNCMPMVIQRRSPLISFPMPGT